MKSMQPILSKLSALLYKINSTPKLRLAASAAAVLVVMVIGTSIWKTSSAAMIILGTLQGEKMAVTTGSAQMVTGAMKLYSSGAEITGTMTSTQPGTVFRLRVKADQCGGSPQVKVTVDGVQAMLTNVPNTAYKAYDSKFATTAGSHTVSVTLTNYTATDVCSQAVYVDLTRILAAGVVADTTPPITTITSPTSGLTVAGTVAVTADATDNVSVAKTEFYLDNALVATYASAPYSYSWDTVATPDGSHTLVAKAYDAAGNIGTSGEVTVTVNNSTPPPPVAATPTEPNLKVAIVGDTNISTGAKSVLSLVKNEGAELLIHVGDFDYTNSATNWENQTNSILGATFPQIAVLGNHEKSYAAAYTQAIRDRLVRTPSINCTGDIGIQMDCFYKGLHVVGTAPGLLGTGHEAYLKSKLEASDNIWNVCAWHMLQNAMQVGSKANAAGWGVYEECRMGGGMPMTGHEHSYSRTKTLTNMTTQLVDPTCPDPNIVCVAKGKTFATVNGLGGRTAIDAQTRCLPATYPYGCKGEWAKISTSTQGANFSVLFVTFNVDGDPKKAKAYLKDISGQVADEFVITRQ